MQQLYLIFVNMLSFASILRSRLSRDSQASQRTPWLVMKHLSGRRDYSEVKGALFSA
ncbi:MAG: hypothetical protein ABL985_07715 [Casimicrobium sp.]